ncbi:spermatogenesis-associated protein 6 isoform X1 [Vanessa atalanta]|uniref:spermatogenesis-associated protein 6 isoform X1 n=1 Tax=Vanessa atalanta TaxID=42275 RepID=UPI001FCD9368|nr:spermatogenesis-associated protein 6 isoform X1 [Vanessa atalanta]
MPKLIELTIEIEVQKVSCPGVWLCQDGRVSLTVFALGTSYHTCLLPPVFPLSFKDIFYFRKRFQESCALNNICCLLKGETIYCELVQWCDDCSADDCVILAQYLGALNDVLFPPNMCSADGVDLLMRRSKDFPGILSPKIEIATKVRIDEIWNQHDHMFNKSKPCHCNPLSDIEKTRQKQVCHSAQYHRTKCNKTRRSRSRSRSDGSRSCCSLDPRDTVTSSCRCPNPVSKSRVSLSPSALRPSRCEYAVYALTTSKTARKETDSQDCSLSVDKRISEREIETSETANDERLQKMILESRFIEQENVNSHVTPNHNKQYTKVTPCVCEICKRYHELFHSNTDS